MTHKDSVYVIDLETSIKNRGDEAIGKMKASPHCPKNDIVYLGVKNVLDGTSGIEKYKDRPVSRTDDIEVLVGQNIKFDLLYLMRNEKFRNIDLPKIQVWDTMLAEHLLTGQQSKMMSLDKLVIKYGGTIKDDRLKEMWENDIDTEDIDESIIKPYLQADLDNTQLVFEAQIAKAKELGMLPLIRSQMDALLATAEMEFNGMHFDKAGALEKGDKLQAKLNDIEVGLFMYMKSRLPHIGVTDITPSSTRQVSLVLFGGEDKIRVPRPMLDTDGNEIRYKTGPRKGQVRTRLEDEIKVISRHVDTRYTQETKKKGVYVVNDEVLNNIIDKTPRGNSVNTFCKQLIKYRELSKDISTYYDGYSDLVWPHDSCIHPQYNQCIAATGRLSHSAPNLGNVSHKK